MELKYKVGDKVEILSSDSDIKQGKIATVTRIDSDDIHHPYSCDSGINWDWFRECEIKLAEKYIELKPSVDLLKKEVSKLQSQRDKLHNEVRDKQRQLSKLMLSDEIKVKTYEEVFTVNNIGKFSHKELKLKDNLKNFVNQFKKGDKVKISFEYVE